MSNFQQAYRGAIALNNYGIALLERKCYDQALVTLRDAMQAMKSIVQRDESIPSKTQVDIQTFTNEAAFRLSNPLPLSENSICIHTLTGEYHFVRDLTVLAKSPSHSAALYPVRIDDLSSENYSNEDFDGVELNIAVVLYNFALANWSFCTAQGDTGSPPLQMVVRLLELPNIILEKLAGECQDEYSLRRIVCMNALVVRTLLRFLSCQDQGHQLTADQEQTSSQNVRVGVGGSMSFPQHQQGGDQMQRHVSRLQAKLEGLIATIQEIDAVFSHWRVNNAPAA